VGEAGEDIRWVPSRLVSAVATPGNDFYLFDGRLAVFPLNGATVVRRDGWCRRPIYPAVTGLRLQGAENDEPRLA
jgi:hypothetical protein